MPSNRYPIQNRCRSRYSEYLNINKKIFHFINLQQNILGQSKQIYPYLEGNPAGPVRDANSYEIDIKAVKANNNSDRPARNFDSRGVQTESKLSYLSYYHPTVNTNFDYMHSILYGVVKKPFFYWFEKVEKKVGEKKNLITL